MPRDAWKIEVRSHRRKTKTTKNSAWVHYRVVASKYKLSKTRVVITLCCFDYYYSLHLFPFYFVSASERALHRISAHAERK